MTFGELVDGIGAKLGIGIENAGGAAALEIDGRTVVLQMADDDLLLVRADLGEIPPDRRDSFAYAALEANYLYQGTGGATLAINPRNGHLHIQKYNWLDRLDPDKVLDTLSRFADTSLKWQKLLSDYSSLNDEASEEAQPEDVAAFGEFMKV
jgi:hypothetical protein